MRAALLRLLRTAAVGLALLAAWAVIGTLYTRFVDDIAGTYLAAAGAIASLLYLPLYAIADARRLPATASGAAQAKAVLCGWLAGLPASLLVIVALLQAARLVRF
ncbi:hypothetical protein [Azospirillum sp. TSO22-1]|uniref:hypothetical protein n=1 Tax=Azospirillum sp. TSO22-1 TaxID=716789 RepID=UPI000D607337|nr:hypothetical protein [Azospirillum sp. TSO22-1]PWC44787.1 hypothetical protein TSO221_17245 [Azospirillum sp. TSO22-1]